MNELKNPKTNPPPEGRWFWIENEFIDEMARQLSPSAFAIYIVLRRYNTPKGYAWPSMKTIAKKMGVSTKTVMRHIPELEKFGLIDTEKRIRQRSGKWAHNTYYLIEPERWIRPDNINESASEIRRRNRRTKWTTPEDNFDP